MILRLARRAFELHQTRTHCLVKMSDRTLLPESSLHRDSLGSAALTANSGVPTSATRGMQQPGDPGRPIRRRGTAAAMSHGRWAQVEVDVLAGIEARLGPCTRINEELVKRWPMRSYMSIVMIRRSNRYRLALRVPTLAGESLREPPNTGSPTATSGVIAGNINMSMVQEEVARDFLKDGFPFTEIPCNLCTTPLTMMDLKKIYSFYGVRERQPRKCKRQQQPRELLKTQAKNKKCRKRERYRRHEWLYQQGPKVLLQELLAKESTSDVITLDQLHQEFDPIFSTPAPQPQPIISLGRKINAHPSLFEWDEVGEALSLLNQSSSPRPDSVKVRELRKIPITILMHILNNFLIFKHVPKELRISRTVFIPKCPTPAGPEDLRPITI